MLFEMKTLQGISQIGLLYEPNWLIYMNNEAYSFAEQKRS